MMKSAVLRVQNILLQESQHTCALEHMYCNLSLTPGCATKLSWHWGVTERQKRPADWPSTQIRQILSRGWLCGWSSFRENGGPSWILLKSQLSTLWERCLQTSHHSSMSLLIVRILNVPNVANVTWRYIPLRSYQSIFFIFTLDILCKVVDLI